MRPVLAAVAAALAAALTLSACSSEQGLNPAVSAVYEAVKPGDQQAAPEGQAAAPRRLTRAMIEKSGLALINARLGEDVSARRFAATTKHGPYVTYLSRQGQHITLNGSMISATRGLGHDLLSAQSSPNDPLKVATPPARWPEKLRRSYRFYGDGPAGKVETFACNMVRTGSGDITIVEVTYPTIRFVEDCTNETTAFQNTYFADARTGFVWRSRQWVGPRLPQIDFDVLEPLTD